MRSRGWRTGRGWLLRAEPAPWAAPQQDRPTWDATPWPGAAAMPGTADAPVTVGTTGPSSPGTGDTGRPARTGSRRLGWVPAVAGIAVMAAAGAAAAVVLTSNTSKAPGPSASTGTYRPAGSANGPAGSGTGTPGSTTGVAPASSSHAAAPAPGGFRAVCWHMGSAAGIGPGKRGAWAASAGACPDTGRDTWRSVPGQLRLCVAEPRLLGCVLRGIIHRCQSSASLLRRP
jgi:hypothetical protein